MSDVFTQLADLARSINPSLPDDLSGQVITITMSKDGCWATSYWGKPPTVSPCPQVTEEQP